MSEGCKILVQMCTLKKSTTVGGIILRRGHYECMPLVDGTVLLFDGTGWLKMSKELVEIKYDLEP